MAYELYTIACRTQATASASILAAANIWQCLTLPCSDVIGARLLYGSRAGMNGSTALHLMLVQHPWPLLSTTQCHRSQARGTSTSIVASCHNICHLHLSPHEALQGYKPCKHRCCSELAAPLGSNACYSGTSQSFNVLHYSMLLTQHDLTVLRGATPGHHVDAIASNRTRLD
jgi:hypothetical protein